MNTENLLQAIKDNTKKNDLPESVSQAVIQAVSNMTNIDPNKLKIINYGQQLWPDGCLGLPNPGEVCTQALVEGWRVVVGNGDKEWIYRTNTDGNHLRLENTNCKEKMMELEGNWILKSGVGVQLLPDTKITAEFKDGKLSGHGGCNQYFTDYTVEPLDKTSGKIQIGNIGSTKIFCGEEINAQESNYFKALEQVSKYNLTDESLILPYPSPSRYLLFIRQ